MNSINKLKTERQKSLLLEQLEGNKEFKIIGSLVSLKLYMLEYYGKKIDYTNKEDCFVFNITPYYSRTKKPIREPYLNNLVKEALVKAELPYDSYAETALIEIDNQTYFIAFVSEEIIKKEKEKFYYCSYCQRHLPLDNFLSANKTMKHQFRLCDDCFDYLTEPTEEERKYAN